MDIEPTRKWQDEIELALRQDAMELLAIDRWYPLPLSGLEPRKH
jgi:hypothetical protein